MGTPVPPEWEDLEDEKWYRVGVDCYQDMGPDNDCTQDYQGRAQCCLPGGTVKGWLRAGWQCESPHELCAFSGFSAQRLLWCHGPYANQPACAADL